VLGAGGAARPRWARPALDDRDEPDVVGPVVVPPVVQVTRHMSRRGEDLEGDVAGDEPREIDVATLAGAEQVTGPEERVGVEIDDGQPLVEVRRGRGDEVRPAIGDRVESALGPRGQPLPQGSTEDRRRHREPAGGERRDRQAAPPAVGQAHVSSTAWPAR
jgi:hypothetical protein